MKHLDPLIILSPATRMGTTLVQRLLCSAADCLIYGDTIGNEASFLACWLSSKELAMRSQAGRHDAMLAAVLAGDTSEFIAELSPQTEGMLAALERMAAGPLEHCKEEAGRHGRPVWGWKQPGVQAWFVNLLPEMLPRARVIRIDRNLEDTARSAKAAGHFTEGPDFQRYIAEAAAARTALRGLDGRLPVHDLRLEDLLADPEPALAALRDFAGCAAIDPAVLRVKVNHPHSPWVPPAALREEEISFIRQFEPSPDHALVA